MKSFARIFASLIVAVLIVAIVIALSGCQGDVGTPTNISLATPTATAIPSLAFAPAFTSTPLFSAKPPSPTATAIPSLAFAPPFTPTPALVAQNLPTRVISPAPVDGDLPTHPYATRLPVQVLLPLSTPATLRLFEDSDLYIHLPPQADQHQPLRVLFALHGMGVRGDAFAQALIPDADRYNWVIVAPTMAYQDYLQPTLLMDDDLKISQMLLDTLDALPARLNLKLDRHVLMYGFSRGAQLAHRFALLHPDRVATVVSISAGSYTLPMEHAKNDDPNPLPFPFGVGDLEKHLGHPLDAVNFKGISFWIGVGERDNQSADVARAFDPYQGQTRIERARVFASVLTALGIDSHLVIFPNTGHEVTTEMRKGALQFLRDDELKDNMN